VRDLARRAHAALDTGSALPSFLGDDTALPAGFPASLATDAVYLAVEPVTDGSRVTAIAHDRVGLLADLAAMFALQRTRVHAARAWAQGEYGVSVWEVAEEHLDPAILRQKYDGIVGGRLDASHRLRPTGEGALAPTVVVRPEASDTSTVLEVRTADRPGVVYLVCAALARLDVEVRSAHVDTLGPQAVDVFYLQEPSAGVLSETRSAQAAHAVREALTGPG
jgi:[protein-PII] uridylyltransferase